MSHREGEPAPIEPYGGAQSASEDQAKGYAVGDQDAFDSDDFGGSDLGYADGSKLKDSDHAAIMKMTQHMPNKIYFDTSRFNIKPDFDSAMLRNARFLKMYPNVHVLISGNADPRGSQDYNFHLAQRRANAVKASLVRQGVTPSQICTVSYGELRPAASPADFSGDWRKAYRLDRRAEISYGETCQGEETHA